MSRRSLRSALVLLMVGVSVATLSGCSTPAYRYVEGPSTRGPFFKVPNSWHQFPASDLSQSQLGWDRNDNAAIVRGLTSWQTGFDAALGPQIDHLFINQAATQPTVYAFSRSLYYRENAWTRKELKPDVARNLLNDVVFPVSTYAPTVGPAFALVSSEDIAQGGAIGTHLVFRYRATPEDSEQTVDQIAMINPDATEMTLLLVRCSTDCYDSHRSDIASVMSSFTYEEAQRGG